MTFLSACSSLKSPTILRLSLRERAPGSGSARPILPQKRASSGWARVCRLARFDRPRIARPSPERAMSGNRRSPRLKREYFLPRVHNLKTLGGDPEVARMMGEDIRFHSENSRNARFVFLGKAAIYSATFMSFFSTENRYLTRGTRLMIHERKLGKQLQINGTTCVATVTVALHEFEASIAIQNEGFENLVRGSRVTMEEVLTRS